MSGEKETTYVVAIGASAGGLEAYSAFFDSAQSHPNIAYILVQHLAPDYKSLLAELLGKHTQMEVREARNRMRIETGAVYVIPPGKNMTVLNGVLCLADKKPEDRGPNTSIDTFFHSLAEEYGNRAIGIVLSGTGSDGSRGLEAIKKHDGFVIVQEPSTARFNGMPVSAINTGCADFILPVERMYDALLSLVEGEMYGAVTPQHLDQILDEIARQTGADFSDYKKPTIIRRLLKRMMELGMRKGEDYLQHLHREDNGEAELFIKDILIGVTRFFRDPDAFDSLTKHVLLPLIASKREGGSVKVWITACSTGEEAYTMAILLHELILKSGKNLELKIFATDLNSVFLEKAARGVFASGIENDIPPDLFARYFVRNGYTCTIHASIRKHIVFARHNLITDPAFSKNDLICCRNMLIYVNKELQTNILSKFLYGLNMHGFLFLGPSEHLVEEKSNFEEVDRKWKIYKKINEGVRRVSTIGFQKQRSVQGTRATGAPAETRLKDFLARAAVEDFGITVFVTDDSCTIFGAAGNTERFNDYVPNQGGQNLTRILPDPLSIAVTTGMLKAGKSREAVLIRNIKCELNSQAYNVTVSIRTDAGEQMRYYISFSLLPTIGGSAVSDDGKRKRKTVPAEELEQLRTELKETKHNLQTTLEELETANEELQSSNEELLSSNEELQSSNEELQSMNEELHTLNGENQQQIKELVVLNDDLTNYFKSSDIGQIIIDGKRRIRRFNAVASKLVNIIERDLERPISDLTLNFSYPEFEKSIDAVLHEDRVIEREVKIGENIYLLRLSSYTSMDRSITGAVLTFINITNFKNLNHIIEGVYSASPSAIMIFKETERQDLHHTARSFVSISGNEFARTIFQKDFNQPHPLTDLPSVLHRSITDEMLALHGPDSRFVMEAELNQRWFEVIGVKIPVGVAISMHDISDRKAAEKKLKSAYSEIYNSQETLKELYAGLDKMVKARTRELGVSEERFRLITRVTSDVIVDWNLLEGVFWVSDNFYKLFGHRMELVLNDRAFWLENIHPSDRNRVEEAIQSAIGKRTATWSIEYRYRHHSGSYRNIVEKGFVMADENGTPYRVLQSMLDITELSVARKEVEIGESMFQLALEASDIAGWEYNHAAGTFEYTRNMPSIFGHHRSTRRIPYEELVAQIHPEDIAFAEGTLTEAMKTGEYSFNARIVWPDKSVHWINTRGRVICNAGGSLVKIIGVSRDFTEEKQRSNGAAVTEAKRK